MFVFPTTYINRNLILLLGLSSLLISTVSVTGFRFFFFLSLSVYLTPLLFPIIAQNGTSRWHYRSDPKCRQPLNRPTVSGVTQWRKHVSNIATNVFPVTKVYGQRFDEPLIQKSSRHRSAAIKVLDQGDAIRYSTLVHPPLLDSAPLPQTTILGKLHSQVMLSGLNTVWL